MRLTPIILIFFYAASSNAVMNECTSYNLGRKADPAFLDRNPTEFERILTNPTPAERLIYRLEYLAEVARNCGRARYCFKMAIDSLDYVNGTAELSAAEVGEARASLNSELSRDTNRNLNCSQMEQHAKKELISIVENVKIPLSEKMTRATLWQSIIAGFDFKPFTPGLQEDGSVVYNFR